MEAYIAQLEKVMPVVGWMAIYSQTYPMQTNIQYWMGIQCNILPTESSHISFFFSFCTFLYRFRHISPEQGIVCRSEGIGPQRQFIGTEKKRILSNNTQYWSAINLFRIRRRCKTKMSNSMPRFWPWFEKKDNQYLLRGMHSLRYMSNAKISLKTNFHNFMLWK